MSNATDAHTALGEPVVLRTTPTFRLADRALTTAEQRAEVFAIDRVVGQLRAAAEPAESSPVLTAAAV